MRSTLLFVFLFSIVTSVFATSSCICTRFDQIAGAVLNCTDITLQGIAAPANSTINLSKLKKNSLVTFAGTTTFAFTNSSDFNPIKLGGKNITITMAAGGVIDGGGSMYWDGLGSNGGRPKPNTFIKVKMTEGSVIENLKIVNWPAHGFAIDGSSDLTVRKVVMDNRAGDAPNSISNSKSAAHNTDGFGVKSSNNIKIEDCAIYNQDDCVAVTSGNNITMSRMLCSGSHGLSIGSVGGKSNNNVTNILFQDSTLINSTNGARIKSNFNTTGFISNITYLNIVTMNTSDYGIDIQQDYLNGGPNGSPSNGVIIENVLFKNVTGTAGGKGSVNYNVLCGQGSCKSVRFENVKITGGEKGTDTLAYQHAPLINPLINTSKAFNMSTAETLRSREVYRYYQPKSIPRATDIPEPSPIEPDYAHGPHFLPKVTNFNTQQSFSDTALTAFAQLIALRLNAQRAIVSLIDHENEYFLAESTSTLSISDDDGAQNAWLSISGARVPRNASLCEHTLRLVPNQNTTAEMTPWYLVPDLLLDDDTKDLNCVRGVPYLRFYCGVPLTNLKGVNIGCVYVVDDRPRTEVSLDQAQFLTKMAATVMDHLEGIRAKEDIVRVTMMSQALHAFIEGDGTMDGDWQRLKRYNLPSGAGVGFQWETNRDDGTGSYRNGKKQLGSYRSQSTIEIDSASLQSPLQHSGTTTDARFNFNNSPWSSSNKTTQIPELKSVFDGAGGAVQSLQPGGRDDEFANTGFATRLHDTFSRASNLVREGMEVDGAVFFDAPFRFYQGRSTLELDTRPSVSESDTDSDSEDDSNLPDIRPGPSPHVKPHSRHASSNHSHTNHTEKSDVSTASTMSSKSDILGFSTRNTSSWKNTSSNPPRTFTAIDQSLLTSLVRRYPQGELFVFDADGPISPALVPMPSSRDASVVTIVDAITEEKRERRAERKRAEILRLLEAFPGARQIFFVPLYDSTSGCFIGSFAWSTSATRIFTAENHLSYLIAFGHSVMSEVNRLNTLSADRAKGDFISNVSHELRSPLHGILASVEFLADTTLDGFQRNLVDTVDICGRTLLDTIEHVLDFSKIKKFGQTTNQPMGVVANLNVSAVIEEVLEGVYAGFEFNGLSSEGLADTTHSRTKDSTDQTPTEEYGASKDSLVVIIDIDFKDQWKFPTVPGTWRRLTMNIFGNALKYTRTGSIKIKLEAHPITSEHGSKSGTIGKTMVTLTVSDTGKGMTPEFMDKKMFMPFSQEDVTAPGTGLGMSIVKQIVDLSGGKIDIKSDLNIGTTIKLSLPLANCLPPPKNATPKLDTLHESEDSVQSVRRRAGGRSVSILGFDDLSGKSKQHLDAIAALKASMAKYSSEWFGLKLVAIGEPADIAIVDESAYLNQTVSETKYGMLLILCSNGARRDIFPSRLDTGQIVEFVSKPCGPHRLAKALLNCLDTEDGTPHSPREERVSNKGPQFEAILPEKALATAVSNGSRLIGDLQSSIGFSPTVLNLLQTPSLSKTLGAASLADTDALKPLHSRRNANTIASKTESASPSKKTLTLSDPPRTSPHVAESGTMLLQEVEAKYPISTKLPPRKPVMLLVEDNPVNMMLLATYMKKNGWEFEKASNGLIALEAFRERPGGFDVIFMDVSMPVMTGYESTKHIRMIETERRLAYEHQNQLQTQSPFLSLGSGPPSSFPFNLPTPSISSHASSISPCQLPPTSSNPSQSPLLPPPPRHSHPSIPLSPSDLATRLELPLLKLNSPALIIALTGFSSQKDQEMAFEAGVDIFMTKPVRFREVGRILEGWMSSREKGEEGLERLEEVVKAVEGGKGQGMGVMSRA
ncbi:hypothetical protein VTL71DRAFT_4462 [Oculimacula yallundae]|uniref:endo-polygalacturonase n=1 Tax=Oculimacula yallundae TaxID=86028 RepID=A0ABR4C4G5_9HELO